MTVVPAATPYTTPEALTVPTAVLELDHTPPDAVSLREVVVVIHAVVIPVMAVGTGLTVMDCMV
jgi:hypothetical protein